MLHVVTFKKKTSFQMRTVVLDMLILLPAR